MAGVSMEEQLARQVFSSLQALSCPQVEGLYLNEADSMLQLLCTPSQHRTDILTWICSSIDPDFGKAKTMPRRAKDPDGVMKEMALLGEMLMLCKSDDLSLTGGDASPLRQLQFLEQLLYVAPDSQKSEGHTRDGELLLNTIFAAENLPHLTQMLNPTLLPFPSCQKASKEDNTSSHKPNREEAVDVAALLKSTQSELERLRSECEFLSEDAQNPAHFSPSALRVAACDLQQLMTTFSHVYDSDLKAYCGREPPNCSSQTDVFQRVQQLLLACNTELEMLKEMSEASASVKEDVNQLQTQPQYWSVGEKRSLSDQLEEMNQRIRTVLSQLYS